MVLAHLGGIPLEESLIYLVPPLAVVACIYALGRRDQGDPPPDDDLDEPPPQPPIPGADEPRPRRRRRAAP